MPSEREIKKLYVNGRTICIEFSFAFSNFQRPQDAWPSPKVAILGAWGLSLNKHFGRCNPAKIAKHVYVCIACQSLCKPLSITLQRNSVFLLYSRKRTIMAFMEA